MCEVCNIKKGDNELLVCEFVDIKVGKKEDEHMLGFYIHQNDEGVYNLSTSYFTDDGDPLTEIVIPIKYCPFCGRKL